MNGNQLVHRVFSNGWQDWYSLGCCGIGAPAAVSWGYGRLDVFLRGNDDAIYHRWCSDGICNDVSHWSDWESIGGVVIAPPAVTSFRPGRLDLFAIGTNSDVFHKVYEAGWDDWNDIGGPYNGGIAAVSLPGGYVSVIGLSDVRQVSSGDTFSLALRKDGAVFAWGNNEYASWSGGGGLHPLIEGLRPEYVGRESRVAGKA